MTRFAAVALLFLLAGCGGLDAAIAQWSDDGGCVICLKTTSDASMVASTMAELRSEEQQLEQALAAEKGRADAATARLAQIQEEKLVLPAFNAEQNRMNAALEDGRLNDLTSVTAVALAEAGTAASNAMVKAGRTGDAASQRVERDRVAAATASLKAELDRLQIL